MWEVLVHLAEPVLRVFGLVWTEDDRPAARWFAVGCLGSNAGPDWPVGLAGGPLK